MFTIVMGLVLLRNRLWRAFFLCTLEIFQKRKFFDTFFFLYECYWYSFFPLVLNLGNIGLQCSIWHIVMLKARYMCIINGISLTSLNFCIHRWLKINRTSMCACIGKTYAFFLSHINYFPQWWLGFVRDLKNPIVGGKFKCAILITCYPRQIKSLYVKSTLHWIIYKTSIYWINVESNFILMWLAVCFSS